MDAHHRAQFDKVSALPRARWSDAPIVCGSPSGDVLPPQTRSQVRRCARRVNIDTMRTSISASSDVTHDELEPSGIELGE